jgi:hypothetical protein
MYVRGDNENEFDNKATLVQILQLGKKKQITWFPYFRTLEPEQ